MRGLLCVFALVALSAAFLAPLQDNLVECIMCEIAVKDADPALEKDADTVKADFDKDCKAALKFKWAEKECENYVNTKLDIIINELNNGTAPEEVCGKLHACESS